jgi:hypothetical protein
LTAAQSFGHLPRPVWSRLGLGVAQGDEAAKPDVDSDTVRPGTIDSGDIDVEYDVSLPVLPRQDRRCRLGRQFSVPADLDVAGDTYEAKTTVLAQRRLPQCVRAGAGAFTTRPFAACGRRHPPSTGLRQPSTAGFTLTILQQPQDGISMASTYAADRRLMPVVYPHRRTARQTVFVFQLV